MAAEGWARLARRTRSTFGFFSVAVAQACGVADHELTRAVAKDLIERVHRGVYRFTAVPETARGQVLAAIYASGHDACASHTTAAALWGLGDLELREPFHLTTLDRCQRSVTGVTYHRAAMFGRLDKTLLGPIPLTAVPRTLVDASSMVAIDVLEDLVIEATRLALADVRRIEAALSHVPMNARGTAALRAILRSFDPEQVAKLMSRLEGIFLRLVRRLGLPQPRVNRRLLGPNDELVAQLDFVWEDARLVVEVDGLRWHSTPSQKIYDDHRQNEIVLSGYRVLRYGSRTVLRGEEVIASQLRRALAS